MSISSLELKDVRISGVDRESVTLTSRSRASTSTIISIGDLDDPLTPANFDILLSDPEKAVKPSWLHMLFGYPLRGSLILRPTSWLDGVRGVAALGVYIFHTISLWVTNAPLWDPGKHTINLVQLPFLRTILIFGGPAVCMFFVVSGYVLTYKCLGWLREGYPARSQVVSSVASSTFRRGFRLYIPVIVLTFCEMIATRFGIAPPFSFGGFAAKPTVFAQALDWLFALNRFMNPYYNFWGAVRGLAAGMRYDAVTWTIPLEYYGSLLCYILLVSFLLVERDWLRMSFISCLSIVCLLLGSWSLSCFLAGMFLADLNLQDLDTGTKRTTRMSYLWWILFTVGFYLAGFPSLVNPVATYGFVTLYSLTPPLWLEDQARFWWTLSTIAMMFSISKHPSLKRIFETYICQYLGKISFSLYLLHAFSISLFGKRFQKLLLSSPGLEVGSGTPVYWLVSLVWYLGFTLVVFIWAGLFQRWVDVPSVRFAKWLEEKIVGLYKTWRGRYETVPSSPHT